MFLRNTLVYYAFIVIPGAALAAVGSAGLLDSVLFFILLMSYLFLYHPIISGIRLVALKKIKPSMIFLLLIPGASVAFFRSLYFPPDNNNSNE